MNLLKRNLLRFGTALMVTAIIFSPLPANAAISPLYQDSKTEQIAKGLTLTDISRLTNAGWLSIKVLDADLNEPTLVPKIKIGNHLTDKTKLTELATNNNAVAAVNSDYFNFGRNTMIGPVVQDGTFIASQVPGKSLNAFSITNDNSLQVGNWTFSGSLTAPDGATMPIDSYNKASNIKLGMFDKHFDAMSPQDIFKVKHITEIVVVNGIAQDVRTSMSGISIPEDGYILCGINAASDFLSAKFKIGDPVVTSISTFPDAASVKLAAGCGAILVQNGQTLKFTDTTPGKVARSGLGYNSQNRHMYLAVADAKKGNSVGMTQSELGQFMVSLGADTVLNLDGGGSSEMVARKLGETTVTVQNSPSDGKERPIAEGIGFVASAPATALAGIKISASPEMIQQGSTWQYSVLGYDSNFNPVSVDSNAVMWSVDSSLGSFTGSSFVANQPGSGIVTAMIDGIATTVPLRVTGVPVSIECDKDHVALGAGGTYRFTVYAVDKDGYRVELPSGSYTSSVIGSIGTINGNTLVASATAASGAVEFNYNNIKCRALVKVDAAKKAFAGQKAPVASVYNPSLLLPQVPDVDNQALSGELNFAVIGDLGISATYAPDKQAYLSKVAQSLKKLNAQMLVVAGKTGANGANAASTLVKKYLPIAIPTADCASTPRSIEMQGSHLIFLNDSNGSITMSNANQWSWLQNDLQQATAKNIFVVMPERLSNFTSKKDLALFTKLLNDKVTNSNCQIWVLTSSPDVLSSSKLNGVKLLATPGANMTKAINGLAPHYLMVSVSNGVAAYQVINIQ